MIFHKETQLPELSSPQVFDLQSEFAMQPYFPFLQIIRDEYKYYNEKKLNKILNRKVYSLHRKIFSSYILGISYIRDEEIILEELEYEQKSFVNDIFNLLTHIDRELDIVIYSVENSSPQSKLLLDKLEKKAKNIHLYCSYQCIKMDSNPDTYKLENIRDSLNFLELDLCKKLLEGMDIDNLLPEELYKYYKITF